MSPSKNFFIHFPIVPVFFVPSSADMTPEQQRAAVHQRLSVVADEIFRILEKMFSEYEADVSGSLEENEGKRQPTSVTLKTETHVYRAGT